MAGTLGDGRVYYLRICSACHGSKGDQMAQVNLHSQDYLSSLGESTLARVIDEGKGVMPGFGRSRGGPLSADEIKAVVGFLQSDAQGKSQPDPRALYSKNCVVCHGADGDKVAGVKHSSPDFWKQSLPAEIFRSVDHGKGGMPAMGGDEGGPLTRQEIEDILAFLRLL
jgi:mono/diheme cytochrome c family protein